MATRQQPPHASNGGSRGYHPEHRTDVLAAVAAGARGAMTPSDSSIWRWATNGVGQRVQTGNAPAVNLRGEHLFLFTVYRLVYPKVEADELIAYIAQQSQHPRLYSRPDITLAETAAGFRRKRGSTTADQAFEPRALLRRFHC